MDYDPSSCSADLQPAAWPPLMSMGHSANQQEILNSTDTFHSTHADFIDTLQTTVGDPVQPGARIQRRQRQPRQQSESEWNRHMKEIRRLYMEEDNTLAQVQATMRSRHGFDKGIQQYKKKFEEWHWSKYLPRDKAQFALQKFADRKRTEGKDTIFDLNGMPFTRERAAKSVKRAKISSDTASQGIDTIDVQTPAGLTYRTPSARSNSSSPEMAAMVANGDRGKKRGIVDTLQIEASPAWSDGDYDLTGALPTMELPPPPARLELDDESTERFPVLTWNNLSRVELPGLIVKARNLNSSGDVEGAERLYMRAVTAYSHMLGGAHEETIKVMYLGANFFAEQTRMRDANAILDDATRALGHRFGLESKELQQHIMHVIQLLDGWNRPIETLAYLAHAKELIDEARHGHSRHGHHSYSIGYEQLADEESGHSNFDTQLYLYGSDPSDINTIIVTANTFAIDDPETAENVLHQVLQHCQSDCNIFAVQTLRAWAELLKLYKRQLTSQPEEDRFEQARQAFGTILDHYHWSEHKLKCQDVIEKLLELVVIILRSPYSRWAMAMFQKVRKKVEAVYHEEDEHVIWLLISIGLIYQSDYGWEQARTWFDCALNAAMAGLGEDDGITVSLVEARKNKRFSYVTDEGRPFKTIFAVSQVRIRPARLHLE